jgi:hypothetical protein
MKEIIAAVGQAKAETAGAAGGSGIAGVTAANNEDGMLYRVLNDGLPYLFDGWNRGDTFTVVGLAMTGLSIWIAWKSFKLRRAELEFKRSQDGRNSNAR